MNAKLFMMFAEMGNVSMTEDHIIAFVRLDTPLI